MSSFGKSSRHTLFLRLHPSILSKMMANYNYAVTVKFAVVIGLIVLTMQV